MKPWSLILLTSPQSPHFFLLMFSILSSPVLWSPFMVSSGPTCDRKQQHLDCPHLPDTPLKQQVNFSLRPCGSQYSLGKRSFRTSCCLLKKVKLPDHGVQQTLQSGVRLPVQLHCLHTLSCRPCPSQICHYAGFPIP
jgi:hypothetical protein